MSCADESGDRSTFHQKAASAPHYRMVLDGQQRLQSLVLAFGHDANCVRMSDRDWADELGRERPPGRQAHWSNGYLCLDVEAFARLTAKIDDVRDIDYREVLVWVAANEAEDEGLSAGRSDYYKQHEPLPRRMHEDRRRFVRLSVLWRMAETDDRAPRRYEAALRDEVLVSLDLADEVKAMASVRLQELVAVLGRVKGFDVGFLELSPPPAESAGKGEVLGYGDAIVNIFTRLNAAGQALTPSEITFAWIKQNWEREATGRVGAEACFKDLVKQLADRDVDLTVDRLVLALSGVWAALFREGQPLRAADLLQGRVVAPMARDLYTRWSRVVAAATITCDALVKQGARFKKLFDSINSLSVLWAWRLAGVEWLESHRPQTRLDDSMRKRLDELLEANLLPWLVLSHWSGTWSKPDSIARFLQEINADWLAIRNDPSCDPVARLDARMKGWLASLAPVAISTIEALEAKSRNQVQIYYTPLWLWHRLEGERRRLSEITLKAPGKAADRLHVDHIVAHDYWESVFTLDPIAVDVGGSQETATVNELGNMMLLRNNFNISKSKNPLAEFLPEVHEFKQTPSELAAWRTALLIGDIAYDFRDRSAADVALETKTRTAAIKSELVSYIRRVSRN
jgi:hypothetical protein